MWPTSPHWNQLHYTGSSTTLMPLEVCTQVCCRSDRMQKLSIQDSTRWVNHWQDSSIVICPYFYWDASWLLPRDEVAYLSPQLSVFLCVVPAWFWGRVPHLWRLASGLQPMVFSASAAELSASIIRGIAGCVLGWSTLEVKVEQLGLLPDLHCQGLWDDLLILTILLYLLITWRSSAEPSLCELEWKGTDPLQFLSEQFCINLSGQQTILSQTLQLKPAGKPSQIATSNLMRVGGYFRPVRVGWQLPKGAILKLFAELEGIG